MPRDDGVDEGPSEDDLRQFGGETRPCPACREDIYDDSEWCPKCGHVMGESETKVSWGVVAITAVVVVVLLLFGVVI